VEDYNKMGTLEIEEIQVVHENSWGSGECCCNCKFLSIVRKHPYNTSVFSKGSIKETFGYVCTLKFDENDERRIATFMDNPHNFCELHLPTKKRERYLKIKEKSNKFF